jgi:hypothetical protein
MTGREAVGPPGVEKDDQLAELIGRLALERSRRTSPTTFCSGRCPVEIDADLASLYRAILSLPQNRPNYF